LFGRLAGKAKEWDDVVKSYERDSLHLPEAGLTLMQGGAVYKLRIQLTHSA
jgi:hypothetical protein